MTELAPEPQDLSNAPLTPGLPEQNNERNDAASESNGNEESTTREQLTIFHSPENFTIKHPLMNKWTLWFTRPPSGGGKVWKRNLAFLLFLSFYVLGMG